MVKCSRFDEREKTSTIINMTGFVTINSLAPNTRYKCKLEVFKLSVELDSSNFVYAVTLIGEACIQPVGFETGIIKEDSITSSPLTSSKKRSIRLYDVDGFWCSIDSSPYIRIDLGRIMTITGLLFRTNNTDVDKIYIKYGINTIDQMKDLRFDKVVGENPRTFDYPKNDTTRDWFLENSFTVKLLEFRSFDEKKPFCVQVEVYGCSEICSSKLEPLSIYHILELNTSLSSNTKLNTSLSSNTKLSNLKNVTLTCIETNQSLRFDFGKILTISGFMMLSQNVSLKLRIRYGDIENMTLKQEVFQTFSTNSIPHSYTTFWFNNQILTKDIEVRPVTEITCMYVVFLGCSSANMKKLGIENGSPGITLTESSFYSSFHTAVNGRLNAMMSDWTINDADKNPWYQICFSVIQTVSAIAVQGQGYWSPAYITGFSIEYGYSANTVSYIYSFNGLPYCFDGTKNRYATSVNQFPVEISAQCLRIVKMKYFRSASGRFEVLGNNITYPPNIIMPKLVFNIKNSTAFVKCVVIGQPGLIIQWRKQNEIIVYNNLNYTIVTSNRSIDINGTYTSELTIKPLVHLNVDNDDNFCHGDIKNVSCFFNYSISTGYTSTNLFVTNTSLIYYGFDAEIDSPNLTIIATNVSINITWTTEKFKRDFQVFYNFSLIEHDGSNNITRDNNISIENIVVYDAKPYTSYTFQLTAFNRLGRNPNIFKKFLSEEGYPSVIQNFIALATSKENISLNWNHPKCQNGIITIYTVEYAEINLTSSMLSFSVLKENLVNQSFAVVVGQLKNYQKYMFRVNAYTNHGKNSGEWSEWIEETTLEGIPSVPEDLIGNVSSSRDISLRWNEPKQLNGIVRSYTVAYSGFKPYNLSFEHNEKIVVNSTQVLISSLYPGTNYTISVNAETIVKGPSSKINITLPYDEPFAPILLKLENQISEQTTIVLHSVPSFTGPISHYEFDIQESSSNCLNNSNTTIKLLYTLEYNQLVIPKGEENITFQTNYIHLSLIGKFCICYRAVINDSGILYMGKIAYLDLERNDLAKIKREEINVDFNSISLRLSQGPLSTKYYQIIVSKGNITNKDPPPSELYPYDEKNDIYLAAEFNASEFMYYENFIVGDGKIFRRFKIAYSNFYNSSYEVLQNVKLQDGEIYSILQRANEHETKYYSTPWLNIQTHKVPIIPETTLPTITSKERTATKGSSISVIGAVSGTALCIIIIVAVIVVLFKRRQKRESPYKKAGENTKLVPLAFKNPSFQSDDEKQKSLEKKPCVKAPIVEKLEVKILEKSEIKKPPETIIVDSSHPPISLKDFAKHWDRLQKDNNCSLSEEYKCLNNGQLYTWDDALLPDVKLKNRYANIVAYDHSRVRLGNSSDVKQNYINASFIHGYTKRNVYIATQGPNISSSNDFWKMIWEQDVPVIVMLTNLVEKGKKKCELYWPTSDAKIFGDVEVTISATDNFSDYVIRKFSIKKVSLEGIKLVHHFQFLHWPDHGAPEFVSDIVLFRHRIRKIFPYEYTQNPVVVHCSAGVGRTGTFICIDEMLELLKRQNKVDIFNYVNFMRSRRIFMIQTEDQYLFVYRAIFESITCGITETMASDFPQLFAGLSKVINLKSGTTTGFEEQFERLKMFISSPVPEDFSNALKDVNKVKNCNQEILASDEKRVLLLDGIYEEGGDYINAVYINGFKRINEYIATQHPLTSTLSDFWTMVFQKKIGTIVMLHDSCKESRLPQLHGVLKHKNEFKNVSVTLNYQEIKGCITFKNLQVNSLNGKDIVECVILCLEWPIDGVPIKNDVITLINEMEKQQSKHGENPVLVVCSDGASRCGTFLACSIILHHLQLEQAVDVFQTIRKIRTSRSQFVNNVIHFKFCYELALTYIDSFNSYSNYIECKT
ncbi:receptor-type tyrosine-protein phosphatase delta isoform X3 [Hydra vulgaris]|uniref:receptor-type tyrosine-protein phosphatase delta isoform X3 n=1 Tax=Hydra vulgaris TaxID=6087 RepID=UPI0032EA2130